MLNQYIETVFYHYSLKETSVAMKMNPEFFDTRNIQIAFSVAKEHVLRYHEPPTATQMKDLVQAKGITELTPDVIDIIYSSQDAINEYAPDWLYDNATSWAQWKNFIKALEGLISYVKLHQDDVSPDNVKEYMERAKGMFNQSCVLDFDDSEEYGSDFWNPESHKRKKQIRSTTGYDFFDLCLDGGYFPGALICLVGSPKIGKSLWLQNLCASSVLRGENNAYISLELPEEMIHNRIGANIFSIPALDYVKYSDDTEAFRERILKFKKTCLIPPGQFIVKSFPTSTLSVPELETYLLSMEERMSTETYKFKFKNIFLDYINIMKNYRNPNSENTYMKIKQLAEDVKAMGIKHNWCIITATQTTREQYDSTDMSGSQVSESVALGATVDAMFGIIADSNMKINGEYFIKCLYDRVSPQDNKRKRFLLDKEYLRIREDISSPIEDVISSFKSAFSGKTFASTSRSKTSAVGVQPVPNQPTISSTSSAPVMGAHQLIGSPSTQDPAPVVQQSPTYVQVPGYPIPESTIIPNEQFRDFSIAAAVSSPSALEI